MPESKTLPTITLTHFETKLGPMYACATKQGICMLEFSGKHTPETELKILSKKLQANVILGDSK